MACLAEAVKQLRRDRFDYLGIAADPTIIGFLDKLQSSSSLERIFFSDEVLKVNRRGAEQKRHVAVTNFNVLNFEVGKYSKAQRVINLRQLRGIVVAQHHLDPLSHKRKGEILLQVQNDYCYRLIMVRCAQFVRVVSEQYTKLTGTSLPISVAADLDAIQVLKGDVESKSETSASHEKRGSGIFSSLFGRKTNNDSAAATSGCSHSASSPQMNPTAAQLLPSPMKLVRGQSTIREIEDAPLCEGWLSKMGAHNTSWRLRYFRLTKGMLMYYEARLKNQYILDSGELRLWKEKRASAVALSPSAMAAALTPTNSANSPLSSSQVDSPRSGALASPTDPPSNPLPASAAATRARSVRPFMLDQQLRALLRNDQRCQALVDFCGDRTLAEISPTTAEIPRVGLASSLSRKFATASSNSSASLESPDETKTMARSLIDFWRSVEVFRIIAGACARFSLLSLFSDTCFFR